MNAALLKGTALREVVRLFPGTSLGSLSRHRRNCLSGFPSSLELQKAPSRLAVFEAVMPSREEVAGGFANVRARFDELVEDAKARGQLSISVAALDGVRKTWADVARIAGHDRPGDTNVAVQRQHRPAGLDRGR